MKKTITYREITVAIGILVAMVIALTLWIKDPGEAFTGFQTGSHVDLPVTAKSLLKSTFSLHVK